MDNQTPVPTFRAIRCGDDTDLYIGFRHVADLNSSFISFGEIDSCVTLFSAVAEALGAPFVHLRVTPQGKAA